MFVVRQSARIPPKDLSDTSDWFRQKSVVKFSNFFLKDFSQICLHTQYVFINEELQADIIL